MKKIVSLLIAIAMILSLASFSSFAEEPAKYEVGQTVEVTYADAEFGWIGIYTGLELRESYSQGSEEGYSYQFAYVEGTGKVVFNDASSADFVVSSEDKTYDDTTKVYYTHPDAPQLVPGDYHIVLFKGTGYEVVKYIGNFTVVPKAAEPAAPSVEIPEMKVVFDENFDSYEKDTDYEDTKLVDFFICEANGLGDGFIKVVENKKTANLFLKNHVFTQVYSDSAVSDPYTFEITAINMQGTHASSIFIRAPKDSNAYYEGDGADSKYELSHGMTGIYFYVGNTNLEINIKSQDSSMPHFCANNTFTFEYPEGLINKDAKGIDLKIYDDMKENIYVMINGQLIAKIVLSTETIGSDDVIIDIDVVKKASIYSASGELLGEIENTLIGAGESTIGWATRCADMTIDDIKVAVAAPAETPTPEPTNTPAPTESAPSEATQAPADSTNAPEPTKEPAKSGCGSIIGGSSLAAVLLCAVVLKKKRK